MNETSNQIHAAKIVSKGLLLKRNQTEKLKREVKIYQSLLHKNNVGFHSFFEDRNCVYILMQLCSSWSMVDLLQQRKTVSEYDCRYYILQIVSGLKYLHDKKNIHRDLKPENILLGHEMEVKICDFGNSTTIKFNGEQKKTSYGSLNYIAPEIVAKAFHSYEVDIWSVGCIMHTLLVGHPPFHSETKEEVAEKILGCKYSLPPSTSHSAAEMLTAMLETSQEKRATSKQLVQFNFIKTYKNSPLHNLLARECLISNPTATDKKSCTCSLRICSA